MNYFAKPLAAAMLILTVAAPAWAQPAPQGAPNAEAMQIVQACLADAGIDMPAPPAAGQQPATMAAPAFTPEQRKVVDDCFAKAGMQAPPAM
jgi:hypothetical protein